MLRDSNKIAYSASFVIFIPFLSQLLLKHEPLGDLRHQYGPRPLPLNEVAMWKGRHMQLVSINTQLDSPIASDILLNLDEANSTYSHSFHNVRKDISQVSEFFFLDTQGLKDSSRYGLQSVFSRGPLPPTPGAETGLPSLQSIMDVGSGIININ